VKEKAKVAEQGLEPNEFSGSGGKGAVFRFSTGTSNGSLYAGGLRDEIRA
jgi:hypothetical protein